MRIGGDDGGLIWILVGRECFDGENLKIGCVVRVEYILSGWLIKDNNFYNGRLC
jgi:hypothetical protein